jgi:thiol-disulfide isomerase/thioredoxin
MKTTIKTCAALGLLGLSSLVSALEIQAYSPQAFATLQAANEPVALHFHADWCSTCKAQEKIFKGWKGDASVPGTLLVVTRIRQLFLQVIDSYDYEFKNVYYSRANCCGAVGFFNFKA